MKLGYSCAVAAVVACSCSPFPDLDHLTGRASPGPDGSGVGGPWVDAHSRGPASCDLVARETYLKSPTPRRSAWFGEDLATDGDAMVITSPFDNDVWDPVRSNATSHSDCNPIFDIQDIAISGAGAVRVFEQTASGWSEDGGNLLSGIEHVFSLVKPDLVPPLYRAALFTTYSVAVSGNRIAVGLAGDSTHGDYRGSVRLFDRSSAGWSEVQRIDEPAVVPYDFYGIRVAMADDMLAVSAVGDQQGPWVPTDGPVLSESSGTSPPKSGAVYLYELGSGAPRLLQRLKAPFVDEMAWFGANIALTSKWLAIAAPLEDHEAPPGADPHADSAADSGAVYVYSRKGTTLEQIAELRGAPTGHPVFGGAVALSGDSLAVGAPWTYEAGASMRGAVHVYQLGENGATLVKTLRSMDDHAFLFGYKVVFAPNALVVGAPTSTGTENDADSADASPLSPFFDASGSVYLFERNGTGWSDAPCRLKASNAGSCDVFGSSVAVARDAIAVGAPLEDGSGEARNDDLLDAGAVYLYTPRSAP